MAKRGQPRLWVLGMTLVATSIAPAPQQGQNVPQEPAGAREKQKDENNRENAPANDPPLSPKLKALGEARLKAAVKQFEESWAFYRQSRTEVYPVYSWSLLVMNSQQELNETEAGAIAALEGHLDRMKRLAALAKKVRRIGFGFSVDVNATEYYRLEAEFWLERARGASDVPRPVAPQP